MRASVPSLHCDNEYGCDEWSVDYYEATAHSVNGIRITAEQRAPGWRSDAMNDFCPRHQQPADIPEPTEPASEYASGFDAVMPLITAALAEAWDDGYGSALCGDCDWSEIEAGRVPTNPYDEQRAAVRADENNGGDTDG